MAEGFSRAAVYAFELVSRPLVRSRLNVLISAPTELPDDLPILFAANHVSWWDGFLLRELHRRLRPDSPFYTVMLASELAKRPYFGLFGCLPIDPDSLPSIRSTFGQLGRLLHRYPRGAIAYFPQGRIWPSTRRPLGFHRGINLLARRLPPTVVVPVGIHIEPLNNLRPTAFLVCGEPFLVEDSQPVDRASEEAVTELLDDLQERLREDGERVLTSWRDRDARLPAFQ